jgi:hypothetical protein
MGRTLTDNRRLSLYNLQDKVENLSVMSGASVTLENRYISKKLQIKTLKPISDNVLSTLTDEINEKFSRFKNFGMYCDHQIAYIKLDPVITENAVRNGKMKGVYNATDSYDASGGLLYKLNQLSNLDEALTFPLSDGVVKYHLCSRNKGKLGNTKSQM